MINTRHYNVFSYYPVKTFNKTNENRVISTDHDNQDQAETVRATNGVDVQNRLVASRELNKYHQLEKSTMAQLPNLLLIAKQALQKAIYDRLGSEIDTDKTYIHYFDAVENVGKGWEHHEPPIASYTLTHFMFRNFNSHEQEKYAYDLNLDYGIYKKGPGQNAYGKEDEVGLTAADLRDIMWDIDLNANVHSALTDFWQKNEQAVATIGRVTFCALAKLAYSNGQLSDKDYRAIMAVGAPHLLDRPTITFADLQTSAPPSSSTTVRFLDINGYPSNDILCFTTPEKSKILYIPHSPQPFHRFSHDDEMRYWLVKQFNKQASKMALEAHFSLYNRQDGLALIGHTGVSKAMTKLGDGRWNALGTGIDKDDDPISDDVFSRVASETKQRMFSDTDILIKSNNEITKERWLEYLQIANQFFAPLLLLLGPIGEVAGTVAFLSQIGLETDIAITGDSEEERNVATRGATTDVGLSLLFGLVMTPYHEGQAVAPDSRFVSPQNMNGKWGYPLSPTTPPTLPLSEEQLSWLKTFNQLHGNKDRPQSYSWELIKQLYPSKISIVEASFEKLADMTERASEIMNNMSDADILQDFHRAAINLDLSTADIQSLRDRIEKIRLYAQIFYSNVDNSVSFLPELPHSTNRSLHTTEAFYDDEKEMLITNHFFEKSSSAGYMAMLRELARLAGAEDHFSFDIEEPVEKGNRVVDHANPLSTTKAQLSFYYDNFKKQQLKMYADETAEELAANSTRPIPRDKLNQATLSNIDSLVYYIVHLLNVHDDFAIVADDELSALYLSEQGNRKIPDAKDYAAQLNKQLTADKNIAAPGHTSAQNTRPIGNIEQHLSDEQLKWLEEFNLLKQKPLEEQQYQLPCYPFSLMKEMAPSKAEIVKKTLSTLVDIVVRVSNIISRMPDMDIQQDLNRAFMNLDFSVTDVQHLRNTISELSLSTLDTNRLLESANLIVFYSTTDDAKLPTVKDDYVVGRYFNDIGVIGLSDLFFEGGSGFGHIALLHELTHDVGTKDYFYLGKKIKLRQADGNLRDISTTTGGTKRQLGLYLDSFQQQHRATYGDKKLTLNTLEKYLVPNDPVDGQLDSTVELNEQYALSSFFNLFSDKEALKKATLSNADSIVYYMLHILGVHDNNFALLPDSDELSALYLAEKDKERMPSSNDYAASLKQELHKNSSK